MQMRGRGGRGTRVSQDRTDGNPRSRYPYTDLYILFLARDEGQGKTQRIWRQSLSAQHRGWANSSIRSIINMIHGISTKCHRPSQRPSRHRSRAIRVAGHPSRVARHPSHRSSESRVMRVAVHPSRGPSESMAIRVGCRGAEPHRGERRGSGPGLHLPDTRSVNR